jgi:hypothetical protein
MPAGRVLRKAVLTFVALTIVIGCITVLFLGMRAVMEIGGSCGSSNTYVVQTPCPEGVGWMIPASIWIGIIALGFYVGLRSGLPGPDWVTLAWPALFLSLGWNFWEYGLDAPGGGMSWGSIICGVLFVLMGAVPLFAVLSSPDARRHLLWGGPPASEGDTRPSMRDVAKAAAPTIRPTHVASGGGALVTAHSSAGAPPATTTTAVDDGTASIDGVDHDLAEDLERLAEMFRNGELTVDEYADAKRRRMGKG